MPKTKKLYIDDDEDYNSEPYYAQTEKDCDLLGAWIGASAVLLGAIFVIESLSPKGEDGDFEFPDYAKVVTEVSDDQMAQAVQLDPEQQILYFLSDEESQYLNSLKNELETKNLIGDYDKYKSEENLTYRNSIDLIDKVGYYGGFEAQKLGQITAATEFSEQNNVLILVPWETCETRGDCGSGGDVCDDCWLLEEEGPYPPELFPDVPHFGCRCAPGQEVVIIEGPINESLNDSLRIIYILH